MQAQYRLCTGGQLGTGLRVSGLGVVVVVIGQPDVGPVSRGFVLMQRGRGPQLPPPSPQLPRFVARVAQPIAAGNQRYRVVVFDVADVGLIAVSRRSVQHCSELPET